MSVFGSFVIYLVDQSSIIKQYYINKNNTVDLYFVELQKVFYLHVFSGHLRPFLISILSVSTSQHSDSSIYEYMGMFLWQKKKNSDHQAGSLKHLWSFTLWVVFQVGIVPDRVCHLPAAPQVSRRTISDPPGLKTQRQIRMNTSYQIYCNNLVLKLIIPHTYTCTCWQTYSVLDLKYYVKLGESPCAPLWVGLQRCAVSRYTMVWKLTVIILCTRPYQLTYQV